MWILIYFFGIFSIAILVFGFFLDLTVRNRKKKKRANVEIPKIGPLLLIFIIVFIFFIGAGSGMLQELKNIKLADNEKFYSINDLISSPENYVGRSIKTEGRFFFLDEWRKGLYIWDGKNEMELVYTNFSEEDIKKILDADIEAAYVRVSGKVYMYSNTLYPFIDVEKLDIKELDIPLIDIKTLYESPEEFFGHDVRIKGKISKYDEIRIYVVSESEYEIPVAFVKLPVMYRDYLKEGEIVKLVGEVKKDRNGYYLQLVNISFE